jgi:probable rRNA maturation factor
VSVSVEVTNESAFRVAEATLAALAEEVLRLQGSRGVLALALVDEDAMTDLNRSYRGEEGPTDVLSFPEEEGADWPSPEDDEHLGDVVLCPSYAAGNATLEGITLDEELTRLVVHGVLHVLGWDHETDQGEMLELQENLLNRLDRRPLVLGQS